MFTPIDGPLNNPALFGGGGASPTPGTNPSRITVSGQQPLPSVPSTVLAEATSAKPGFYLIWITPKNQVTENALRQVAKWDVPWSVFTKAFNATYGTATSRKIHLVEKSFSMKTATGATLWVQRKGWSESKKAFFVVMEVK